ncbi:VOC family protein [Aquimarina sp. D1M17]|uniref:VOC family protein n=1 Tax=Aquimarina acroporae TaxID=2937283 RepID=UPI0020BDAF31|nr:VOC family protein [Aquimarina acroporae]MCK8523482.1 VOC family protein [Aquimarina acroporae]
MNRFHLAFKVKDIQSTYKFYHKILGCKIGRKTDNWVDFDFFGHQLSAHVSDKTSSLDYCGKVDEVDVPIPHFGCILKPEEFEKIKNTLASNKIEFIVKPQIRYKETQGEQQTMFVLDFSNNPIEFKSFNDEKDIF